MQGTKSVENVLDEIINAEFGKDQKIESVSVVSKSGLIITGDPSRLPAKPEMFSAMISVIFSSAESSRVEPKKDKLEYVIGVYKTKKIFVWELSQSLMIAITCDRDIPDETMLSRIQNVANKTKEELVWLR
ncbi:MAG TPA: hypothetical protein VGK23_02840 [Methanomassiliicoccales archaeon]